MKQKLSAFLKKALTILLSLVLGAGLALAGLPWASKHLVDQNLIVFELGLFALILVFGGVNYVLMILLHEAGHLVAGLLSGYQFVSYRAFSLMLISLNGRLTFKRFSLAGTAGQCLMKPPAWTANGIPVRLYNLGGLLVNALLCAVSLPFAVLLPLDTLPGVFFLMMLIVNAWALLTNGLPLQNNDGDNVLHLAQNLDAQYAFWQQMTAHAMIAEGTRQRDLPPELYALPENADLTNPLIAAIAVTAAQMHIIFRDYDAAEAALSDLAARDDAALHPAHRFLLKNDQLFLELIRQNRADAIAAIKDKQFIQYRKAMGGMPSVIRTQYAEALASHDDSAASAALAKFDKIAQTYPYTDEVSEERAILQDLANHHFA